MVTVWLATRGWTDGSWVAVGAIGAAVQGMAVIGALVYASRQLAEVQEARDQRDRPFVLVDFNVSVLEKFIHLDVVNLGSTLATDISFDFEPPLVSAQGKLGKVESRYTPGAMLSKGIRSLVPGARVRTIFDFSLDRKTARAEGLDLADMFAVKVEYRGPDGRRWTSNYEIDLDYLQHRTYVQQKSIHDAVLELERIRKLIARCAGPGAHLEPSKTDDPGDLDNLPSTFDVLRTLGIDSADQDE